MKLALITAIWKRHDLEKITINRLIEQSKKHGFEVIIAGSEGDVSQNLAKGCHYVEIDNFPVSNKHNALLTKAKELDVDGVILIGSDCLLSNGFWTYAKKLKKDETKVVGLTDAYFYDTISKQMGHWKGYKNGTQSVGSGRFFSKAILDKVDWKLWDDGLDKGLDTNCTHRLNTLGIKDSFNTMKDLKAYIVDVKHTYSITDRAIVDACDEIDSKEFVFKFGKKDFDLVNKLEQPIIKRKEIEHFTGYKTFIANNKAKHLKSGQSYELTHEIASIFINNGYLEL